VEDGVMYVIKTQYIEYSFQLLGNLEVWQRRKMFQFSHSGSILLNFVHFCC